MGCTVCEERVSADRIRLLARRDDLLFIQVDCSACGSSSLGFVSEAVVASKAGRLDGASPVSSDDVLDMHAFLESWTGDLETLVSGRATRSDPGTARGGQPAMRRTERPA